MFDCHRADDTPFLNWLLLLPFAVLIAMLLRCSSDPPPHPTGNDVAQRVLPAFCDRVATCRADDFKASWGTRDACVSDLLSLSSADARTQPSSCSSSDLDRCVADVSALSCTSLTGPVDATLTAAFPSTCGAC